MTSTREVQYSMVRTGTRTKYRRTRKYSTNSGQHLSARKFKQVLIGYKIAKEMLQRLSVKREPPRGREEGSAASGSAASAATREALLEALASARGAVAVRGATCDAGCCGGGAAGEGRRTEPDTVPDESAVVRSALPSDRRPLSTKQEMSEQRRGLCAESKTLVKQRNLL